MLGPPTNKPSLDLAIESAVFTSIFAHDETGELVHFKAIFSKDHTEGKYKTVLSHGFKANPNDDFRYPEEYTVAQDFVTAELLIGMCVETMKICYAVKKWDVA